MTHGGVNTSRREDIRHTAFPEARGFRRLRRPGSIGHVLRTDRWVRPGNGFAFRAGSEGSYNAACWRQPQSGYKTHRPPGRYHNPLNPGHAVAQRSGPAGVMAMADV
ncbi:MAG TPA: hypothetical protein DGT53_04965 [Dialister sp.]|nr:hypothetical protein [Dialister sp.]